MTYIVTLNRQVINPLFIQEQAARRAMPRAIDPIDDEMDLMGDWYDAPETGTPRYIAETKEIEADNFEVNVLGNLVFVRNAKTVATYAVNQWTSVLEAE